MPVVGPMEGTLKTCPAGSEGSPYLPYPWKGLAKGPFSSEAGVGGRGEAGETVPK